MKKVEAENDIHLLCKGVAVTFLTNYVEFQSNILTRQDADKQQIFSTVKTVFNEMLNNGDVDMSDWQPIVDLMNSKKFQTMELLSESIKKDQMFSLLDSICTNCISTKGKSLSDQLSVENIKVFRKENKLSTGITELLALVKYKKELDEMLEAKMSEMSFGEGIVKDNMVSMINKYGKLLPAKYISSMDILFNGKNS